MNIPSRLSDRELEAEVARLARCERTSRASLVAHLAELYGRRLHERAGYASLFTYCMEVLRCSEHEAYDRMKAAKVARRFPKVLDWLASGELNLTAVRLLAPHLTRSNHADLLGAARGKRKRQVQELLALRFPKPDVAASVRKLPSRPIPAAPVSADVATGARPTDIPERTTIPPPPPPLARPLAPARYQITFTGSAQTRKLLELAQDLLRHAVPSGDPAEIVTRALEVLVQDLLKKRFAVTDRPRGSAPASESRYIPADGSAPSTCVTSAAARSSARAAGDVESGRSWSSTTPPSRSRRAESPRWTTSSCAAGPTTATWPIGSSRASPMTPVVPERERNRCPR